MVMPVSGIRPVTPPATTKTWRHIAPDRPIASSLPNGSRAASAVLMPRSTSSPYSSRTAISPASPSSSPTVARM